MTEENINNLSCDNNDKDIDVPEENIASIFVQKTGLKKILVVEDDHATSALLDKFLKTNGYDVIVAHNGRMGMLVLQGVVPDLIISDVMMPEMNGFDFFKQIRQDKKTAHIPFIVLTGHSEIGETFKDLDIDAFFSKPIDSKKLLVTVKELVENGRSQLTRTVGPKPIYKNQFFWIVVLVVLIGVLFRTLFSMMSSWQERKMDMSGYIGGSGDQDKGRGVVDDDEKYKTVYEVKEFQSAGEAEEIKILDAMKKIDQMNQK